MTHTLFHPLVDGWFRTRFGAPTEPQQLGWPKIAEGRDTLIAAPTGSGKTLAAFLVCLDRLVRQAIDGPWDDRLQVIYVSPLKALSNDIERNLQGPLGELSQLAETQGYGPLPIRVAVRTGDTPGAERQAMVKRPPHILVTTPESLYMLLTAEKARGMLRSARTVIVDEIHALARDKRGSHLTLTLERLDALCGQRPVRIGLSATQRPMDEIARFLVGVERSQTSDATCALVDVGHVRQLDLAIETPPSELSAVCSLEQWGEVYARLLELIQSHRSTLVFVNTRRLAERVCHALTELLGEKAVASHHGSLSRSIRLSAEQRLKAGELKAIVATASLELGIDIGYIDLVCQIGSPRSIATFLQRVGRSGHSLGAIPKGRLFPLTRDELLECVALVRAVRRGDLDRIEMPVGPLDILAQQIVASAACDEWSEDDLFALCRRAWPYRDLERKDFDAVVGLLADGIGSTKRGAYLHRDLIHRRVKARRGARLAAITSGGAIPENAEYRVVTEQDGTLVGTVDEDFAIDSLAGDVFLLGNSSWRIRYVRGNEVVVQDAEGAPPSIPFWFGEAPARTVELSAEISQLRRDIAERQRTDEPAAVAWVAAEGQCDAYAAEQAVRYVAAEVAALGLVPTREQIVYERFFDEAGGMQLVIHSPFGARINRAWGLSLRKRFCRGFDFELQAAATDNGILLSLSSQHSFPIDSLFKMLGPHNGERLLEQAVLAAPVFQVRWRWNVTRALAVLRWQNGKKVPPFLQKFRAEDLLGAAFPAALGCLENHSGDIEIPDHPLVRQTMHDCLHEAMDVRRWLEVLAAAAQAPAPSPAVPLDPRETPPAVEFIPRDTFEPSPFCHEILNANPYAFLDPAPLEERRTRAISTRRSLSAESFRDLARLDPEAVQQVVAEAWPLVRDADELHDALMNLVAVPAHRAAEWSRWFEPLAAKGRAAVCTFANPARGTRVAVWIAAERWPVLRAIFADAVTEPPIKLPPDLDTPQERHEALVVLVRGWLGASGPITAESLGSELGLEAGSVFAALEAVEAQGAVLRGQFVGQSAAGSTQWCDRRLLARIHRRTLDGLRKQIQPVSPADFVRFLTRHQRLLGEFRNNSATTGPTAVREVIGQLQGFEMPAGAWERHVLAARLPGYEPGWLDQAFLSGELMWGRLRPPQRDERSGQAAMVMTRVMPIALLIREDLPWLLPPEREANLPDSVRANARAVWELLGQRGASFFPEIKTACELLPAHLEEALRELAAWGFITSDLFAAVRTIVEASPSTSLRRGRARPSLGGTARSPVGRWSRFPGLTPPVPRETYLERWCDQLLRRYGVVFRDLLARESAAPSWHELVPVFRRQELRGTIRGGRFVERVGGEQYATEDAVQRLRALRDEPPDNDWLVISAADPLNLSGILDDGPRIPATHKNALILQHGRCVAMKQAGEFVFLTDIPQDVRNDMRRALQLVRKLAPEERFIGPDRWTRPRAEPVAVKT